MASRDEAWLSAFRPAWVRVYYVLGIATVIEASDPMVEPAVVRAFGIWEGLPRPRRSPATVRVRVQVSDASEGTDAHPPVQYRLDGTHRLFAVTPGSTAMGDAAVGEAWARVSRALVAETDHFRYGFVEALVYFLLSSLDRQPFHGAALERDGRVLVLSGAPGVGKSTLAYAASLNGFRVMAEDIVWIQQRPHFRLWGATPVIHLPSDGRRWFPDLAPGPTLIANGRNKVVVPLGPASRPLVPVAEAAAICVVARRSGATTLTPIDREAVQQDLTTVLQAGFDRFPTTIPAVVAALAPEGGWRLSLGAGPAEAVPLLHQILDATTRRA